MSLNFTRKLQFANTAQGFFQNLRFETKLVFIADVLILAAATPAEIWAWRRSAQFRRLENLIQRRVRKTWLVVDDCHLDLFSRKNIGNKNCFRALSGSDTGQSIAAVNQFFNREFHARSHVKQTKPRQRIALQESFVQELLLQLIDLCSIHLAAVCGDLPVRFGANRDELVFFG